MCSDYEAYGLKRHGLTWFHCIAIIILSNIGLTIYTHWRIQDITKGRGAQENNS